MSSVPSMLMSLDIDVSVAGWCWTEGEETEEVSECFTLNVFSIRAYLDGDILCQK